MYGISISLRVVLSHERNKIGMHCFLRKPEIVTYPDLKIDFRLANQKTYSTIKLNKPGLQAKTIPIMERYVFLRTMNYQ